MQDKNLRLAIKGAVTIGSICGVMAIMVSFGASPMDFRFWAAVVMLIALAINHEMR